MKKHLILGAALLLSSSQDWAATPYKSTGTADVDEKNLKVFDSKRPESRDSISKDIKNDGIVNGPILQDESEREEELFDEIDNQDGTDREDKAGAPAVKSKE